MPSRRNPRQAGSRQSRTEEGQRRQADQWPSLLGQGGAEFLHAFPAETVLELRRGPTDNLDTRMNIHMACERGDLKAVRKCLDADPSQLHARDRLRNHPLHVAAWQRREKIAQLLLEKGADVNARGDHGRTPLHYAVENNTKPITTLLVEHGADPGIRNDFGVTPLYSAASVGDNKLVVLLLHHGATKDINSALHLDGAESVLDQLMSDPTILERLEHPEILLWDAIRVKSDVLVRYLLARRVDPNIKAGGLYPLHHAISHQLLSIVRILLDGGADVTVKDHVGQSLLAFCEFYRAGPEIRALLTERGAQ
jgi:ankyrin repeat protein